MHSRGVVNPLKDIDPTATGVQLIPHSRFKLKIFSKFTTIFRQTPNKRFVLTPV